MKRTIIALSLATAMLPTFAAEYFVVVPFKDKGTAALAKISVALSSQSLPSGIVGLPYTGVDLSLFLSVSGDPGFTGSGVSWALDSGALPAGLSLGSNGVISGTPTAAGTNNFTVKATYKTKSGQQSYQIVTGNLVVGLAGATLSAPVVNTAYATDFKNQLSVTGDPAYNISQVQFSAVALPSWLQLSQGGVLSGTPVAKDTAKTLTISASYKGATTQQNYTLPAVGGLGVKNFGSYRAWADGELANSCQGYLVGDAAHDYSGETGNGVYRISVSGAPKDVYCDMTGGGWTLIMTGAKDVGVAGWYNATSDYNVPAVPTASSTVTWKFADATINAIPKSKYKLVAAINYPGTYYADGRCTYAHNTTVSGYCATTYTNEALSAGARTGNQGGGISDNNGSGYRIFTNNSAAYASYGWCAGNGGGGGGCGGGGDRTTIQVWVK